MTCKQYTWTWEDINVWKPMSDDDIISEYDEWCDDNCPNEWEYYSELFGVEAHARTIGCYTFKDEETAMAFWLAFNEYR
jgi:hypothetical protein